MGAAGSEFDRRSHNRPGEPWHAYALLAPHGKLPKYVGSTFDIRQRLDRHRSGQGSRVRAWLEDLRAAGQEARVEVLAIFYDRDSARDFEGRVIRSLRARGVRLLNSTAPRSSECVAKDQDGGEPERRAVPVAGRVVGGAKLRAWIGSSEVKRTQREFSQKTGIGQQLLSAYCNGLARPLPMSVNALRIQAATGGHVTVWDWMTDAERVEYRSAGNRGLSEVG